MASWLLPADDILRRAAWTTRSDRPLRALAKLGGCLVVFALLYGAVMGTYRIATGQEEWLRQIVYSAVKAPLLLAGSFLLGLPFFFVLTTLMGLRRDFGESVRALVAAQAGLAIVLASLSPLTLLCYASSGEHDVALMFNGAMFAIASLSGQYLLRAYYRPLIRREPRHRRLLICWAVIYVAVGIQLAWLLRPFIGSPKMTVRFLRPEALDNAYVYVARLIWRTIGW